MNAATLLPDWRHGRPRRDDRHEHPGGLGPLYALRDRYGVELAFVDAGDDGDDDADARRLRRRDHARHPAGLDLARAVDDRARSCRSRAIADARPRARRARRRRRRAGRRRDPVPVRRPRRRPVRASPAQKWLLGPEGMGALVGRAGRRSSGSRPALGGWFSFERVGQRRRRRAGGPTPAGSRRPATTGRRSSGWPARSAGCRCTSGSTSSTGAGRRMAARGRRPAGGDPRRHRPDAAPRDGDARHVPDRRLAGARRRSTSSARGSSRSPGRSRRLDALRISVGFFTTEDELERFAEAVELLAAHTPETLPPRRA